MLRKESRSKIYATKDFFDKNVFSLFKYPNKICKTAYHIFKKIIKIPRSNSPKHARLSLFGRKSDER
jgi:hypothetical protein